MDISKNLTIPKMSLSLFFNLTLVSAISYLGIKWLLEQMDPTYRAKTKAREVAGKLLQRFARNGERPLSIRNFNDYEMMIAVHLVHPDDISVQWSDIAGLDDVIKGLRNNVIFPVQHRHLFQDSRLSAAPKGVLLHGPPGCGKTLIAKATAKEAGMNFINLDISTLTDKWYGESQKLAAAVFSLAVKLQPCIIFIDEIDSFLRSRSYSDHESTAMMKTQFMSLWDGLITDSNCTVIIMGATNRPRDLDEAILRRMSLRFNIGLPNMVQRRKILELILRGEPLERDIDFRVLAEMTEGLPGSDLKELCRSAAMYRVRDFVSDEIEAPSTSASAPAEPESLRPISMGDLLYATQHIVSSKLLSAPV
ncbi:outer mitochondrial transmembrane helix translocase-like [Coccinella septempunctata]|uniref:outer mitochondrial transmembrane helix translocase-like n=1 Tax=Coccinella septempunctata TaxID=41139 RepID=UPI001D07E8A3|nr:outer mitochondrial transmembrane helix translocase-like [Coccinella septempunctata]